MGWDNVIKNGGLYMTVHLRRAGKDGGIPRKIHGKIKFSIANHLTHETIRFGIPVMICACGPPLLIIIYEINIFSMSYFIFSFLENFLCNIFFVIIINNYF